MAAATLLILSCTGVDGANFPPPHCSSEAAESLPPRLRRICAALYGIAEISEAVEQYVDDKSKSMTPFKLNQSLSHQKEGHFSFYRLR